MAQKTIIARGIEKSFQEKRVLGGVDLEASPNEVLALIGPSGSGKSTLLRCLNHLVVPDRGEIQFDGISLTEKSETLIRSQIGFVFQKFNLWTHFTVQQNVEEALRTVHQLTKKAARERALSALEEVGLHSKRVDYPAHLSGGEQQRVALARALAIEPKLLLLDEPTSSLDPVLSRSVLEIILKLAQQGRTMILATHEISFAREIASKTIFLNNGLVTEEGSHILQQPQTEELRRFLMGDQVR